MPKRSTLFRLFTALLAPVLFIGLIEGVLRIAGFTYDPTAELAGQVVRDELAQPMIYRPHPRYLWTLLPSTVIDVPPAGFPSIRTNSLGLRGPELPSEKAPGEFRVLCFGDSVIFGLGLREAETIPSQLESALREHIPGARAINMGVPGWSSLQGRRLLEDHRSLEPDAIVFWFGMNDAKVHMGTPDRLLTPGEAPPTAGWLRDLRTVQFIRKLVVEYRRTSLGASRVGTEDYLENLAVFRASGVPVVAVRYPERVDSTVDQLRDILAQAEEAGVERVVGPVPVLSPVVPAPPGYSLRGTRIPTEQGPILRFSGPGRVLSVTVSRLGEDLERLSGLSERFRVLMEALPDGCPGYEELFGEAAATTVFEDNCHLTPAGARLAGRALAESIRTRTTARRR